MTYTISYRLPTAQLVVSGTVRRTRDAITGDGKPLAEQPAELVAHAFAVRHVAADAWLSVTLPHGFLRTFSGSFSFTTDGRLTSARAEGTGEAGTLLSAAATLAGAALGLRGAVAGAGTALGGKPVDPVDKKYAQEHPAESRRRADALSALMNVRAAELTVTTAILNDDSDRLGGRWTLLERIRQSLESELAVLDAHRGAWRAGTIETVDEIFEFAAPLTDLENAPGDPATAGTEKLPGAPRTLADLWKRFGVGVTASWGSGRSSQAVPANPGADQIAVRVPDVVTLSVVEKRRGVLVVTSTSRHVVVDDRSGVRCVALEKSLFGRRSVALSFDADGLVTGAAVEGSASLSAAASSLASVPAAFAGGVDSANKAAAGLATAQGAAQAAELATLKQRVELEQQRITEAGLLATAADTARLERLKQQAQLVELQAAIAKGDPGVAGRLDGEGHR